MRYTIEGFSQEFAMTLKKKVERKDRRTGGIKLVEIKIDCTDLIILRWFVDFYPKIKKMVIDGKEYAWITHNKLVQDLPLIDISKEAFNERMKKLVEFKILDYKFIKDGGSFSLYCFGENYINLVSRQEGTCSNIYGVGVQTGTGVGVQTGTKDNSINNSSIIIYIYELFDKIWAIYPRKRNKETAKNTWAKKLKKLKTKEDIYARAKKIGELLSKYIHDWSIKGTKEEYIPHFSSWLNSNIPDIK